MKTNVRETSLMAYEEIGKEGKLGNQQKTILQVVNAHQDYSLQELCVLTKLTINVVSGRVNDLKKLGLLVEGEKRHCSITERTIKPVKLPKLPVAQRELFAEAA